MDAGDIEGDVEGASMIVSNDLMSDRRPANSGIAFS